MIDQFRIPDTPFAPEYSGDLNGTSTPETLQPRFAFIKTIEQEIEARRREADESVLARTRIARIFSSVTRKFVSSSEGLSLERRLVDVESEYGGAMFPLPEGVLEQRFWYHDQDWFYEQTDQQGRWVSRYHVEPEAITKIIPGRAYQLEGSEADYLVASITRYKETIDTHIYASDRGQTAA